MNIVARSEPRPSIQRGVSYNLDPHEVDFNKATGPMEEFKDIPISKVDKQSCLKLGKNLTLELKSQLITFLKANLDVFA